MHDDAVFNKVKLSLPVLLHGVGAVQEVSLEEVEKLMDDSKESKEYEDR